MSAVQQMPSWYPTGVNHIIDLDNDPAPYGPPCPEILEVLERRLPAQARIVDIAGGYGRYAVPLTVAGHHVTVVDIDPPHLAAAQRNGLSTVLADVTRDEDLDRIGGGFDASLNAAFLYLASPAEAKAIFKRCASLLRHGGLAVVQFSTNIVRKDRAGNVLKGETEHCYTLAEGRRTLLEMFAEAGFGDVEIASFTIHDDGPCYFHADALVASGVLGAR